MTSIIHYALLVLLPVVGMSALLMKNLISAVIVYTILSLFTAVVIFQLRAPDVALSLLVVNAVAAAIFLFTVHKTEVEE